MQFKNILRRPSKGGFMKELGKTLHVHKRHSGSSSSSEAMLYTRLQLPRSPSGRGNRSRQSRSIDSKRQHRPARISKSYATSSTQFKRKEMPSVRFPRKIDANVALAFQAPVLASWWHQILDCRVSRISRETRWGSRTNHLVELIIIFVDGPGLGAQVLRHGWGVCRGRAIRRKVANPETVWKYVKVVQTEPTGATLPLLCESCSTPVIPKVWHQRSSPAYRIPTEQMWIFPADILDVRWYAGLCSEKIYE